MTERTFYQPELPLGVYRELAAHCAIFGIDTTLIPQMLPFAYEHSQVGGITCRWQTPEQGERLQRLLDYYARRYQRPWQETPPVTSC
ncbi:MAG: hypothetical protein RMI89_05645 [Gloeomargarita sp. SKYBB_i_bin120]|nr:hypothetical protein [Gloeomargarita sp. SKYB120]MDW8178009.1 hypothetical protein [Gloeomargarita sp. SKYBB_i_bin120]